MSMLLTFSLHGPGMYMFVACIIYRCMTLLRFLQVGLGLHDAIITSSHLAGFGVCMTRRFQACCKRCPLAVVWGTGPVLMACVEVRKWPKGNAAV